jgi:hypothetical protein
LHYYFGFLLTITANITPTISLMKTFTFNLDFIEDLYSYGLVFAAGELFQFMSDELKKGNAVILVRSAKNNQPETSQTIMEKTALDNIHAAIRNSLLHIEQPLAS